MPSANVASSWDFTAVIDLLRTPTKPSKSQEAVSGNDSKASRYEPTAILTRPKAPPTLETPEHKRLGDFDALWDVLRQPTRTTSSSVVDKSSDPISNDDSNPISRLASSQPISILTGPTNVDSFKNQSASNQDASAGILSDSTVGGVSDGDISIFDSPVQRKSTLAFIPSQVNAIEKTGDVLTPPSSCEEDNKPSLRNYENITKKESRYKSSADRKAGLVLKLGKHFPEFMGLTPVNNFVSRTSSDLHVFVDVSNISIGLHDCYKIHHDIPVSTQIRRLPLSFHNFSLILERGRPVAKKVLAGSDRFPAINEAEKLGYEVNILSRVHKAKEFTPRQAKFRNALNQGASSEMGFSPPERWVEQGVDEILHLKMLESLIDTDKPATIVLATGDAAEAEFSGGFLRMVERALQKGWIVELVSFAMNTSFAYKRKAFRAKWGTQFRMINLEDYVEEMLDM